MVTESFFRLKADVFSLLLSVLCVQSHDERIDMRAA